MPEQAIRAFGLAVKRARLAKRLSQQALSDLTGISKRHIAKIENGSANPSFEIMAILSYHLNLSIDNILYEDNFSKDSLILKKINILLSHCTDSQKISILKMIEIIVEELTNNS